MLPFPVIDNDELAKIVHINADGDLPGYATHVVRGLYDVDRRRRGAARRGSTRSAPRCPRRSPTAPAFIVLSDRDSDRDLRADPVAAADLRGAPPPDPREDPHPGRPARRGRRRPRGAPRRAARSATAPPPSTPTSPWSPSRTWSAPATSTGVDRREGRRATCIKALGKGVLKVMSKMGISTVASYTGAQIFEAIGLSPGRSSTATSPAPPPSSAASASTSSPRRSRARHATAYPPTASGRPHRELEVGGEYQWRREGEPHLFDPETVFRLQHATRAAALRHLQAVHRPGRRAVRAADDAARPVRASGRRPAPPVPHRRGRAGQRDRQAVHHRRDVLRLDQPGGARDPGHRDEPARRPVQHRRGRRGRRPAARPATRRSRDQAGRLRPVRRDQRCT